MATASRQKKQKIRPPKEWIIPANPKYYDIVHAFDDTDEIDWKQGAGIKAGDTVFMYVASPVSAILYKCKVTETDIPYKYADENLTISALMKIKLLKRYKPERFTFDVLKEEYGIYAIRGPRGIPNSLRFGDRIGEGSYLAAPVNGAAMEKLVIGKNCFINGNLLAMSRGGITIGDNVQIAGNVQLLSNNHDPYDRQILTCKPIVIKDGAWIGAGATILSGVTIGKFAIVGAASVVTHDVGDYEVAVGSPARVIKTLDKDKFK